MCTAGAEALGDEAREAELEETRATVARMEREHNLLKEQGEQLAMALNHTARQKSDAESRVRLYQQEVADLSVARESAYLDGNFFSRAGSGFSQRVQRTEGSSRLSEDVRAWTHDVFIIHAGPQKPLARRLRTLLNDQLAIRAFVDSEDIACAGDADQQMRTCLRTAPLGVALLSTAFFNVAAAPRPLAELRTALDSNKLMPVLLRELSHDELHACLDKALRIPVRDPDLQFASEADREGFAQRVLRTAALQYDDVSEAEFLQRLAWAMLENLAEHCITLGKCVTEDMPDSYSYVMVMLSVALHWVAREQALSSHYRKKKRALSLYLELAECLGNLQSRKDMHRAV